jgi:ribosomal protein L7/L12
MPLDYQTVARTLAPYVGEVNPLLDAADAIVALAATGTYASAVVSGRTQKRTKPAQLDASGLNSQLVMTPLLQGRKINAIKELRQLTPCGLKEAKESVERIAEFPVVKAFQAALMNERLNLEA